MVNVLGIILPAALVVLIGWAAMRLRTFSAEGARGLSSYTFNVAFSALLFRIMRDVRPQDLDIDVLLAYFAAALLVWALAMALGRFVFGLGGPERTIMGMAGAVSNNGVLGIPLVLTTWGEPGLVPLLMIMAVHSAITMSLCSVLMEWHRGGAARIGMARRLGRMMLAMLGHPVVIAILAGLAWGVVSRSLGLAFPKAIELALKWLGDSAVPCGLFVLGVSLAGIRLAGDLPQILVTAAIKLGLQPLCVWLLGRYVFDLQPLPAAVITLTAAMPTAVNVYIMADRYGVFQQRSTSIVLVSTVCGVASLAGWLSFLT
jgi:predicted permease